MPSNLIIFILLLIVSVIFISIWWFYRHWPGHMTRHLRAAIIDEQQQQPPRTRTGPAPAPATVTITQSPQQPTTTERPVDFGERLVSRLTNEEVYRSRRSSRRSIPRASRAGSPSRQSGAQNQTMAQSNTFENEWGNGGNDNDNDNNNNNAGADDNAGQGWQPDGAMPDGGNSDNGNNGGGWQPDDPMGGRAPSPQPSGDGGNAGGGGGGGAPEPRGGW